MIGAERFLSELKTTANLPHPHILPLFDSGEVDGYLYYVMPSFACETHSALRTRIGCLESTARTASRIWGKSAPPPVRAARPP